MDENLIGYALGALDEPTKQQVEGYLREHPEAQNRLLALRLSLAPLALDKTPEPPPPALAERTLAVIAGHICDPVTETELPQAPALPSESLPGGRSWWRRADVLVAACLLLMGAGIGLTVLGRLHGPSSQALMAQCKYNLLRFYVGLSQYHDFHGQFPDVTKETPRHVAGMVVPLLLEKGMLPKDASIRCPGNGPPKSCQFTLTSLRMLSDEDFAQRSPSLSMCYAYSLGFRDDDGSWHAPGTDPKTARSQLPLMADRPPTEGVLSNSVNHGGSGQNVLFGDGHVTFLARRTFGNEDDIFLNREQRVAAGVGPSDIVLGFSAARP